MRQIGRVLIGVFAGIGMIALVYTIGTYLVVQRYCQMEVLAKVRSPDGSRAIEHIVNICSKEGTIKHQLSVGDFIGILNSETKNVEHIRSSKFPHLFSGGG